MPLRLLLLASMLAFAAIGTAGAAQDDPTPAPVTVEEDVDSPVGEIIPKPNSGTAPDDPGDRGGPLQLFVLALIVAFVALAVARIRAAGRKKAATQP